MRVLYLYNNSRRSMAERVQKGEDHDNHFFGLFRLQKYGVTAEYLELETVFPKNLALFLRKRVLSMHFFHTLLVPMMRKYDVVLTSSALGTLLLRRIFKLRRPKWVMFDYNFSGIIKHPKNRKERLLKYLLGGVDGIITLSEGEAQEMKRLFPRLGDRIRFMRFAADLAYFSPLYEAREEPYILSVGRDPGRDWKTLADAIRGIGTPVHVTATKSQFEKSGDVPEEITFHYYSPEELLQAYRGASVVVISLAPEHPFDAMGSSSLVEAMAMGKAVVATDTATMREYIRDGENGMLVPMGDSGALRKSIQYLIANPEVRNTLGQNARTFAEGHCEADSFARDLSAYLRQIVEPDGAEREV